MLTQNRQKQSEPLMPPSVKQQGVTVKKSLTFPLLLFTLTSTNPQYDAKFLNNYASINMVDALARISGVGEVFLFGGSDYAMHIWLKAGNMAKLGVTVDEVKKALNDQNIISPGGKFGAEPAQKERNSPMTLPFRTGLLVKNNLPTLLYKAKKMAHRCLWVILPASNWERKISAQQPVGMDRLVQ